MFQLTISFVNRLNNTLNKVFYKAYKTGIKKK